MSFVTRNQTNRFFTLKRLSRVRAKAKHQFYATNIHWVGKIHASHTIFQLETHNLENQNNFKEIGFLEMWKCSCLKKRKCLHKSRNVVFTIHFSLKFITFRSKKKNVLSDGSNQGWLDRIDIQWILFTLTLKWMAVHFAHLSTEKA